MALKLLSPMLLGYAAFTLQTAVEPLARGAWFAPRLVLSALAVVAAHAPGRFGIVTAALWGLFSDALGQGPFGIDVVCFVTAVYAVQCWLSRSDRPSVLSIGLAAGLIAGTVPVASLALRLTIVGQEIPIEQLVRSAAIPAISTAILTGALEFARQVVWPGPIFSSHDRAPEVSNRWRMLTD